MTQYSRKQVEKMAIKEYGIGPFMLIAMKDWVSKNSHALCIAIDGNDKTCFGEFQKGWKSEMFKAAEKMARDYLVEDYIKAKNGRILDGVIWL